MYDYGMSGWGFGMGLGWLIPLLLIVVLVYYINNNKSNKKEGLTAKEILDKRYVNGEIDEQAYKRKRELLEEKDGASS
jgi:putative membrane protein